MAYRDNTKTGVTMHVGADSGKKSDTLRSVARPGSRNHNKPAGADAVGSANGNTPRPGYKQKSPKAGGTGSIARPGGAQIIRG